MALVDVLVLFDCVAARQRARGEEVPLGAPEEKWARTQSLPSSVLVPYWSEACIDALRRDFMAGIHWCCVTAPLDCRGRTCICLLCAMQKYMHFKTNTDLHRPGHVSLLQALRFTCFGARSSGRQGNFRSPTATPIRNPTLLQEVESSKASPQCIACFMWWPGGVSAERS